MTPFTRLHPLLLVVVVVLLHQLPNMVSSQSMPRFKRTEDSIGSSPGPTVISASGETWHVGHSNAVVFMSYDTYLLVRLNLEGVSVKDAKLACQIVQGSQKSSQQEAVSELDMSGLVAGKVSSLTCGTSMKVELTRPPTSENFMLKLTQCHRNADQVFQLGLSVWFVVPSSGLVSGRLRIFCLDAINQINDDNGFKQNGVLYFRIFTKDAVEFMVNQPAAIPSAGMGELQFLDSKVVALVNSAPNYVKRSIALGAYVSMAQERCPRTQNGPEVVFSSFPWNNPLQRCTYLSLEDGKLYYAKNCIPAAMRTYISSGTNPHPASICSVVKVNDGTLQNSWTSVTLDKFTIKLGSKESVLTSECYLLNLSPNPLPVKIYSDVSSSPLVCPIVCSSKDAAFYFYGPNERILIHSGTNEWKSLDGGTLEVNKANNAIRFKSGVTRAMHAGLYKCRAAQQTFRFNVTIVSLPKFTQDMPEVAYAVEGESFAYSCSAEHSGLEKQPSLTSELWLPNSANPNWRQATITGAFPDMDKWFTLARNQTAEWDNITVTVHPVPAVTAPGSNFTHRFVCTTGLSTADAAAVGLPDPFEDRIDVSVHHIERPRLGSFVFDRAAARNCCASTAVGATYEVMLNPRLSAYLASIGVEVIGRFKIDGIYLSDRSPVSGLMHENFNSLSNMLSFKMKPIVDAAASAKVLRYLSELRNLTPVFSFHYPSAPPAGLRLFKRSPTPPAVSGDARDCLTNKRCFYSTEFDPNLSSGLRGWLDFAAGPAAVPAARLSAASVAGITVAVIVLLLLLLALLLLLVLGCRRGVQTTKVYRLEAKERSLGRDPTAEARGEQFKEYQRAADGEERDAAIPLSVAAADATEATVAAAAAASTSGILAGAESSTSVAIDSEDELDELAAYDDELLGCKFAADGSVPARYTEAPPDSEQAGRLSVV